MKLPVKVLIVLITATIVAFLTFDFSLLRGLISGIVVSSVEKNLRAHIHFDSVSVGWFEVSLNNLSITPKGSPLDLLFSELSAKCPSSSLWGNFRGCTINFLAYQGSGELKINQANQITGSITGVQIHKLSFLTSHGFETGTLDINPLQISNSAQLNNINGIISISNLTKTKSSNLSPSITGLPIILKIDPFTINTAKSSVNLDFDVNTKNVNQISIEQLEVESDLGSVRNQSHLKFGSRGIEEVKLFYQPSAIGLGVIKPYAQFLCPPESLTSAVPLRFSFDGRQPSCQIATN